MLVARVCLSAMLLLAFVSGKVDPKLQLTVKSPSVIRRERLGGLLKVYDGSLAYATDEFLCFADRHQQIFARPNSVQGIASNYLHN